MALRILLLDPATGIKYHAVYSAASGVKTKVLTGETWTVPAYEQATAHLSVQCDGDIYLEGDLVII